MEGLERTLAKVPIMVLLVGYLGWMGFDYYEWLNSNTSSLGRKKTAFVQSTQNLETAQKKLKSAQEFFSNLETLKLRIRQLATQLDETKAVLTTNLDVAKFVKMVTLEAKKLRLTIQGIKPTSEVKKDFYIEVPFKVQLRGAYAQMMVFFDRISKLQQVIRVGDFNMKPSGNTLTRYVELEGEVTLVAFKYLGTNADKIKAKLDEPMRNPLDSIPTRASTKKEGES